MVKVDPKNDIPGYIVGKVRRFQKMVNSVYQKFLLSDRRKINLKKVVDI